MVLTGCGSCRSSPVISTPMAHSPEEDSWICFDCGSTHEGVCTFCGQAAALVSNMGMYSDWYQIRLAKF
ncbi:hypothetical protein ACF09J_30310 [Streptomyces sp. NPDC014889]|uniref:hypothetical protein n=1 Tax=Streptomyces sp. NPDC014889 TaxID=3364928 RepID=UPI0036F8ACE2